MLLSDFSIAKGKFAGTELPIIEESSHSYKTHGKNIRKKGRSHNEKFMQERRRSTARRVLDETFGSDNGMLRASGNLYLDIDPYLKHYNESGWQLRPGGRGWHSSEKNDDRRTRMGWVQDLEYKKWKQKRDRMALDAVRRSLFRYRTDPYSWSDKPNYKPVSNYT